jgi:hypothetical protein
VKELHPIHLLNIIIASIKYIYLNDYVMKLFKKLKTIPSVGGNGLLGLAPQHWEERHLAKELHQINTCDSTLWILLVFGKASFFVMSWHHRIACLSLQPFIIAIFWLSIFAKKINFSKLRSDFWS